MLEIRRATEADIPVLRGLAERIWRAYYPPIIGAEQVEYMLGLMYAPATIEQEMRDGTEWFLASLDGTSAGFLSLSFEPEGQAKMNKLYLLPELHGRGFGAQMITHAASVAQRKGATELFLQVNKGNTRALRAYERAGFKRVKEAVFDIGGGYVMDDYVLSRSLNS